MGEETRTTAREAVTVGKTTMEITKEMKVRGIQSQMGGPATYPAVAAQGPVLTSTEYTES